MLVNCTNFVPICVIDLTLSLPIFLFINKTDATKSQDALGLGGGAGSARKRQRHRSRGTRGGVRQQPPDAPLPEVGAVAMVGR